MKEGIPAYLCLLVLMYEGCFDGGVRPMSSQDGNYWGTKKMLEIVGLRRMEESLASHVSILHVMSVCQNGLYRTWENTALLYGGDFRQVNKDVIVKMFRSSNLNFITYLRALTLFFMSQDSSLPYLTLVFLPFADLVKNLTRVLFEERDKSQHLWHCWSQGVLCSD